MPRFEPFLNMYGTVSVFNYVIEANYSHKSVWQVSN